MNPPRVRQMLDEYHELLAKAAKCREDANTQTGGLLRMAEQYEANAATVKEQLRGVVETCGNYRDDEGNEARIEERVTLSYDVKRIRECVSKPIADLVIVESVDANALKALMKGGLVKADQLEPATTRKIVKAFIVR